MILHIDTKDQKVIRVSLKEDKKVIKSLSAKNKYGSQVLLPLIIKLVNRTYKPGLSTQFQTGFAKLKGIEVETGPGSFTGIRVGVAVANALAYSLKIPVNGKRMETELQY